MILCSFCGTRIYPLPPHNYLGYETIFVGLGITIFCVILFLNIRRTLFVPIFNKLVKKILWITFYNNDIIIILSSKLHIKFLNNDKNNFSKRFTRETSR